jgi:aminoglycoside 2'-N-acetyltransferase I
VPGLSRPPTHRGWPALSNLRLPFYRCHPATNGGYPCGPRSPSDPPECKHGDVPELRTVHTADLTLSEAQAIRYLLDNAFDGRFGADDWENTLGGVHTLVLEQGELVGHVAVVQRRLWHHSASIRTGYVEGLAVRRDRRRCGLGSAAMSEAERVIVTAYDLGALSDGTSIEGFYQRRGWWTWRGPTSVVSPTGLRRTEEDDGAVLVLPTPNSPNLDLSEAIACDYRPGDVW